MNWARRFRARQYIRGSLWILPLIGGLLGVALGELDVIVDKSLHLSGELAYSASTASTLLTTIVGAMAALTGFVVTVTTLVVQMATGTFSARYMRLWYRDRHAQGAAGDADRHAGVLVHAAAARRDRLRSQSRRVRRGRPRGGNAAAVPACSSIVYLHRLRPVAVAVLVADYVRDEFVPQADRPGQRRRTSGWGVFEAHGERPTLVVHSTEPGAIQAIDVEGLVRWAREHERLVVFRHTIGDFVPTGAKLIEVFGGDDVDVAGGEEAPADGGARRRAYDRAGSGVRDPDHGRHRRQSACRRPSTIRRRRSRCSTTSATSCD